MISEGKKILIHTYPDKITSGTRFYIHARNIASAVMFLIDNGVIAEKYNITGEREVSNLEMAHFIAKVLDKPLIYELIDFHSERKGHDCRYSLDGSKLNEMGWKLPLNFEESLTNTINWTLKNKQWLEQ
jgi:dTDP-glucose 4,6-dehydratase